MGLSGGGGTETPAISPHDPDLMIINCDMSGAYRTEDGGRTWELIHWKQLIGCPFCAPAFDPVDPDTVFAAFSYAATLRVSHDRGRTWEPTGQGLSGGLRMIAIDPDDAYRMLAGTEKNMYASTDSGMSWRVSTGIESEVIGVCFDRVRGTCFAATNAGVFCSDDKGLTWSPVRIDTQAGTIVAFGGASNPNDETAALYCWESSGAVFLSIDGGCAWEKVSELSPGSGEYHRLLVTDVAPRIVYAIKPVYSAADTVYRSDDYCSTWRPVAFCDKTEDRYNMPENFYSTYFHAQSMMGWATCGAAIDPSDPEHVLFNNYCSVFITKDGGSAWSAGEVHLAPGQDRPLTNDHRWIGNGLCNTTTWNYYVAPANHDTHFICYTDVGLVRSDDRGTSWRCLRDYGSNCYELCFDPDVPDRLWAAFGRTHDIPNNNIVTGGHYSPENNKGSVGYSEDGGATFIGRTAGMPGSDEVLYDDAQLKGCHGTVVSIVMDPSSPVESRVLYASLFDQGVFRSEDGGVSWEKRSDGLGAPGVNMRVCRIHMHSDGTLFCSVTGVRIEGYLTTEGVGVYKSVDQGKSWGRITEGQDFRWVTDFSVDPRDSRIVYVAVCDDPDRGLEEGGLYKTVDGGDTWKRVVRKGSLHFGATLCPDKPDHVYMTLAYNDGNVSPLWLSTDAGETWLPFEDYPFSSAHRVTFDPDDGSVIYVTGYGASAWKGPAYPHGPADTPLTTL